jgi:hypothetical protein
VLGSDLNQVCKNCETNSKTEKEKKEQKKGKEAVGEPNQPKPVSAHDPAGRNPEGVRRCFLLPLTPGPRLSNPLLPLTALAHLSSLSSGRSLLPARNSAQPSIARAKTLASPASQAGYK